MSGTKAGAKAAAITNKAKHDAEYMKKYGMGFYQYLGHKGGQAGRGHKFGHGKVDPRELGKIGGKISKRGAKL